MGEVSQALGTGTEIEFEGRQWQLAPMTYELQAKFEAWLERRAVDAVKRQESNVTEPEYQKMLSATMRDIAAGVYSFGAEVSVQSAKSIHGLKELVRLSLSKNHPVEVNREFVDRLFESKMFEAVGAIQRANSDPLSKTPPPSAGG